MRATKLLLLIVCVFSLQWTSGCTPPEPAAVLTTQTDATGKPLNESPVFAFDVPRITCSLATQGMASTAEVYAEWSYYEEPSWRTLKRDSLSVGNSNYLLFSIDAPAAGWPSGSYNLVLTKNNVKLIEKTFTIKTDSSVSLPVINNFALTPSTVTSGQQFTLSWNVSGASRVVIMPDIGSVESGGSRLLTASSDMTYTLTALNSGGASSMSVNLKAVSPQMDNSDLVIVDVFREVAMVYYKVRNNGSAASRPCSAVLYVGTSKQAVDYIAPLNPGQERTEVFGIFNWNYKLDTPVMICIDPDSEKGESNRQDKCILKLLPGIRTI